MASVTAEKIFDLGPLPVTNSLIAASTVTFIIIVVALLYNSRAKLVPTRFTGFVELFIEYLYTSTENIAGKKAKIFFPIAATFFIIIITNSYFGLLPIVGPIGVHEIIDGKDELVPIFRSINADLNATLVLALISVIMTHVYAIKAVGPFNHLARYLPFINIKFKDFANPKKIGSVLWLNFINLFVGILELISEFVKIVSLSFRLFGNIFAGETVLATVSGLLSFSAFLIPLPFIGLELIVGYVQATVFMLLTVVFMTVLSEKHGAEEETH